MSAKFQNKYRNESIRLQHWDYRWDAAYFITICTKDREHFFGKIVDGKMRLSPVGAIADVLWYEIKNHAKNVELGEYIVMPNHVHGIIILNGNNRKLIHDNLGDGNGIDDIDNRNVVGFDCRGVARNVPTIETQTQNESPNIRKNERMSAISPKPNSVSTIIRSYKSAVTKHANRLNLEFGWQPLFYDHVIRDRRSLQNISGYIRNNPLNWKEDKFF